jgi:phage recombination protein Bet
MSTTDIAARSELVIEATQTSWSPQQVAALRQLGVDAAADGDLSVFFHVCNRTGLDPFARQIYMIGRNSKNMRTNQWETKYTIQTGIDGFRLIARRASDRARTTLGYEDTVWCGDDGQWTDVWLSDKPPRAAKLAVIRDGQRYPAVALMSEYMGTDKNGTPTRMWQTKGALMLAKCAEALALRKAFPQDLSGLYTADEMQASNDETPQQVAPRNGNGNGGGRTIFDAKGITRPEPAPEPAVDADNLAAAIDATDDPDTLRQVWHQTAGLPAEQRDDLREVITAKVQARQDYLDAAAAEPVDAELVDEGASA